MSNRLNEERNDQFRRYLGNQMEEPERSIFEEELEENAVLLQEYKDYRLEVMVVQQIEKHQLRKAVKQWVEDERETIEAAFPSTPTTPDRAAASQAVNPWKKYRWPLLLLLVVSMLLYYCLVPVPEQAPKPPVKEKVIPPTPTQSEGPIATIPPNEEVAVPTESTSVPSTANPSPPAPNKPQPPLTGSNQRQLALNAFSNSIEDSTLKGTSTTRDSSKLTFALLALDAAYTSFQSKTEPNAFTEKAVQLLQDTSLEASANLAFYRADALFMNGDFTEASAILQSLVTNGGPSTVQKAEYLLLLNLLAAEEDANRSAIEELFLRITEEDNFHNYQQEGIRLRKQL